MKLQSKLCAALLAASSLTLVGTAHAADGLMSSIKSFFAPATSGAESATSLTAESTKHVAQAAVNTASDAGQAVTNTVADAGHAITGATEAVTNEFQAEGDAVSDAVHGPFSCKITNLKISTDRSETAKSETLVVTMVNNSKTTCTMMARPDLHFATRSKVGVVLQPTRGMMPGPVLLPVTLRPQDAASMKVTWNTVEPKNGQCIRFNGLTMSTHALNWRKKIKSHICGAKGAYVAIAQNPLKVKTAPQHS